MELVNIANYIYDIERQYHKSIRKLTFLSFNVWQIYRNHLVYREFESNSSAPAKTALSPKTHCKKPGFLWGWIKLITQRKDLQNKVVLYASSAFYSEKTNNCKTSAFLGIIQKELDPEKAVKEITVTENDRDELSFGSLPVIDIDDSFLKPNTLVTKAVACLLLPLAMIHCRLLNKFVKIKITEVSRLLSQFLISYWFNIFFYLAVRPKCVILCVSSYGNEAKIAALRKLNVSTYEYQHGQVFKEHHGYNFSNALCGIKHRMILPDKMLVYGEYWKTVLLEEGFFNEDYFIVCGHPVLTNARQIELNFTRKVIAVFSSPYATIRLIQLIENYFNNSTFHSDYNWIIKCHPRENKHLWEEFATKYDQIKITNENTYNVLNSVKIVITASLSILYESTYFGNSAYCFFPGVDVKSSKSWPFKHIKEIDSSFTDRFDCHQQVNISEEFYQRFSLEKLFSTMKTEVACNI